jgi:hypothetical protein
MTRSKATLDRWVVTPTTRFKATHWKYNPVTKAPVASRCFSLHLAASRCVPIFQPRPHFPVHTIGIVPSSGQLEWYQNDVNDRSIKVQGGLQRITTLHGYVHPINVVSGLPYITIRPYTDEEWETLPHVIWTGDTDWDPTVLDHTLDDDEHLFDAISDREATPLTSLFDEFGDYRKCAVIIQDVEIQAIGDYVPSFVDALDKPMISNDADDIIDHFVYDANRPCLLANNGTMTPSPRIIEPKEPDYETLRPFFGWSPSTDTIKHTFEVTTQYARMPMSTVLKKRYKSPNPAP